MQKEGFMGTQQARRFTILMLPWLAHGHISPFLELAKTLADRNFHVYLCSTPINLSSVRERVTNNKYSCSIKLVELHLPSLPELPPHYHTTNGLPTHLNATLNKAFEMASPAFSSILKTLNPDLFIDDLLQPWADAVASAHNIPVVHFLTSGAATVSFFCHKLTKTPDVEFPFPEIYLRDFELEKIIPSRKSSASNDEAVEKDDGRDIDKRFSDTMLIKSSGEIEAKYLKYFSGLVKRKILPVGTLVQDPVGKEEHSGVIQWLGTKDQSSTVFVSFGSEYFLSKEEMEDLAYGLEVSSVNFIWVIRFPVGEETKVEEVLPEGFLDRVRERGMIIKGWAPQARILRHPSVGGFVSHCGWGSAMESLKFGVPIIAMPIHLDQPLNARLMVELGIAMEVLRDENGRFHREEVVKVIRELVGERKGEDMRRKARTLSEKISFKGEEEIGGATDELTKICEKRRVDSAY